MNAIHFFTWKSFLSARTYVSATNYNKKLVKVIKPNHTNAQVQSSAVKQPRYYHRVISKEPQEP